MLHPSPTTKIDPTLTRATIAGFTEESQNGPACVVLTFANTNYEIRLEPATDIEQLKSMQGETVLGTIHATARRIDPAQAGGRCIDPCVGRPRRIMGTIVGTDPRSNAMVVNVGPNMAVWLTLGAPGQRVEQFQEVPFLTCDIFPGASFRFKELA